MTAEDIPALIAEVRLMLGVCEWDEPGEVDAVIERLIVALETVTAERDALREVVQSAYNAWHMGSRAQAITILSCAIDTKEQS